MSTKLPINLNDLLRQRTVEGERIEYKTGWNPDAIIRTLCAFANDFENLGGGYVVSGQNCDANGQQSEIEIAPVFHRLPERIRAHASICFMALILYRVMRQRLKLAGHAASPETVLAQLRRIQRQSVSINQGVPITGISTVNSDQANMLAALNVKNPNPDTQLSLL